MEAQYSYFFNDSGQLYAKPSVNMDIRLSEEKMKIFKQNKISMLLTYLFYTMNKRNILSLEKEIECLLTLIKECCDVYNLALFCKMVLHTRDILFGKGYCDTTYLLIWKLYSYYPDLAFAVMRELLVPRYYKDKHLLKGKRCIGSWKDMKKMCHMIYKKYNIKNHPLIEYACEMIIKQLINDIKNYQNQKFISLLSKWIPREKTKYNWLFRKLAFKFYYMTEYDYNKSIKPQFHVYKNFRKTISTLSKPNHIIETKQCSEDWNSIKLHSITGHNIINYKSSMLMKNNVFVRKNYQKFISQLTDRTSCFKKFYLFARKVYESPHIYNLHQHTVPVSRVIRNYFNEKKSVSLEKNKVHKIILDKIMKQRIEQITHAGSYHFGKYMIFSDFGLSTTTNYNEEFFSSFGVSLLLSQVLHPAYKDKVITFSSYPILMNLRSEPDIYNKLTKLANNCNWNMDSNLYKALNFYIKMIMKGKLDAKSVSDTGLIFISKFDINSASSKNIELVYDNIMKMFENSRVLIGYEDGKLIHYEMPHIIFWNINQDNTYQTGLPMKYITEKNVTLFSGDNLEQLNNLVQYKMYHKKNDIVKHIIKPRPRIISKTRKIDNSHKVQKKTDMARLNSYFFMLKSLNKKQYMDIETYIFDKYF